MSGWMSRRHPFTSASAFMPMAMLVAPVHAPASAAIWRAMRRLTAWPTLTMSPTNISITTRKHRKNGVDWPRSPPLLSSLAIVASTRGVALRRRRRKSLELHAVRFDAVVDRQPEPHARPDAVALPPVAVDGVHVHRYVASVAAPPVEVVHHRAGGGLRASPDGRGACCREGCVVHHVARHDEHGEVHDAEDEQQHEGHHHH